MEFPPFYSLLPSFSPPSLRCPVTSFLLPSILQILFCFVSLSGVFKAFRLKRVKKADLKCSREFTSCKSRSESQMGGKKKKKEKSQCMGPKGWKNTWKASKTSSSLWEIFYQNVLSATFISWVFSELCFKIEILPWAYVNSQMNWKLSRNVQSTVYKFYFVHWIPPPLPQLCLICWIFLVQSYT